MVGQVIVTGPDDVLTALIDPGSFVAWRLSQTQASGEARGFTTVPAVHPPGDLVAGGAVNSADDAGGAINSVDDAGGALNSVDDADDADDASVVIGEATIDGIRVALILSDFAVVAGSVGREQAERIVAAMRTATQLGLPVVASPASGGTRIQEGTPAFARMIDIALACGDHRAAGNMLIVWLRSPTTGGVMATWGSLGQVTFGEPGALAGFLGPRLFEPLTGSPIAAGVQTTDNLARVGIIDAVVALADLRSAVTNVLEVVVDRTSTTTIGIDPAAPAVATGLPVWASTSATSPRGAELSPWDAVLASRNAARPGLRELMAEFESVTALHGTGTGERSDAVGLYLAGLRGQRCVVIGQDRAVQFAGAAIGPTALRTAQRGIALAAELGLPLVSVVDTSGGELSKSAEEGALAGEIARTLTAQVRMKQVVVSVLLGMGGGGAALAMLPADRVLAAESAWLAPLPIEGASLIRFRDTDHVVELASIMRIDSTSMLAHGVIDEVIPELPAAAQEPVAFIQRCAAALHRNLTELGVSDPQDRLDHRSRRYGASLRAVRA